MDQRQYGALMGCSSELALACNHDFVVKFVQYLCFAGQEGKHDDVPDK